MYNKILMEKNIADNDKGHNEWGGWRVGWGLCKLTTNVRMIIQQMLATEMYDAFMDLEMAYYRVDWKAMWDLSYGVGEKLLREMKEFNRNATECVNVR